MLFIVKVQKKNISSAGKDNCNRSETKSLFNYRETLCRQSLESA